MSTRIGALGGFVVWLAGLGAMGGLSGEHALAARKIPEANESAVIHLAIAM
jgi:hypothetical protein